MTRTAADQLPRNHEALYDRLAGDWFEPRGAFAALRWLAEARARLIPPAARKGAVLLDVGCGGGLMAPHVPAGYRHVGVDRSASAAAVAAAHGVDVVLADAAALPLPDASADVVLAGELLEHVIDVEAVVGEAARVLREGGTLIVDTINATWFARFSLVTLGERLPGGPPPRCHDPELFVDPDRLRRICAAHGIALELWGLRVAAGDYLRYLARLTDDVRMLPTSSLAALYQGHGRKAGR